MDDHESPSSFAELGHQFENFAKEYRGASPLYEQLARATSRDQRILALAAHTRAEQPAPHLLLAAVHLLLLRGERHPVARFYPTVAGSAPGPGEDPYPVFREFCLEHEATIRRIVSERLVQTNEPRRCAALLPALQLVAQRGGGRHLALIEIGASAGLNLLLDRYGYDYGEGRFCGEPDSPVQITCEVRGTRPPPLPSPTGTPLRISFRVGLDIEPVDVRDPEQTLWLQALVWPDENGRAELLNRALELARADPPRVVAGDAVERLPQLLAEVPPSSVLCLIDFFTLQQLQPEARERLRDELIGWVGESNREVFHVAVEGGPRDGPPQLRLVSAAQALEADAGSVLAHCDRHGSWLEWLDEQPA